MKSLRALVVVTVLGCVGFASSEAQAALAAAAGGSGLSGTLSKNKAIRKQQLIADPAEPVYGSTSVTYDPNVVSLSGILFGPGYTGSGSVEVDFGDEFIDLIDLDTFLANPGSYTQTGYVQVFFSEPTIITSVPSFAPAAAPVHGQITPPAGYTVIDNNGPAAVDTHAFFFDYLSDVPDSTVARYTIYADSGGRGSAPDFLNDGQTTIPFNQIAPAFVSGSLDSPAIPLPAAVWIGGLTMLGSLGYSKLRRGKVA